MNRLAVTVATLATFAFALLAVSAPAVGAWDASLTARLVNVGDRAPVAGVEVKAYPLRGGTLLAKAVSDEHGVITLDGLRGGEYRLDFTKSGYHDTTLVGVYVRPHQRDNMSSPIAMYPMGTKVPRFSATNPCGKLLDPAQVADEYVICSE